MKGIDAFRRKFAGLGRASETISKNGEIWTLIGQLHLPIPIKVISEIKLKEEEEVEFGLLLLFYLIPYFTIFVNKEIILKICLMRIFHYIL